MKFPSTDGSGKSHCHVARFSQQNPPFPTQNYPNHVPEGNWLLKSYSGEVPLGKNHIPWIVSTQGLKKTTRSNSAKVAQLARLPQDPKKFISELIQNC